MPSNPYQVVKDFESALCEYTGAPFAVTTMSATMALLLAVAWHTIGKRGFISVARCAWENDYIDVEIPKRTYVSVPMSIINAGANVKFRDEQWKGFYQLKPLPVWDCARLFTSGMYHGVDELAGAGKMLCVSFHWSKTLGIQQGGAILLDDPEAAAWLRRARFDGRTEGVPVSQDKFDMIGWHCYLSPEIAAEGLQRIGLIPKHNEPLPWDDYPDLSQMEIFK